jgi:signal transduction histidine kinase
VKALGDAADLRRTSLRLGLQSGLLVVGCLFVVGGLLFAVYERAADAASDRLLRDATSHIDSASEAPPGVRVVVVTPRGRTVSPGMPAGLPDEAQLAATGRDGRTRQADVVVTGDHYTLRTARVGTRVTQAVLDRHEAQEERGRILSSLLVAGVAGVLLAALVAAWLARRTVGPMAQTIAMQRRFVADASHELRTPLTLLSTRVQLLARRLRKDPGATSHLAEDVDGVLTDTRVLTEILDDLLASADTRATSVRTPVDLVPLVQDCVAAASATAAASGVTLTVSDDAHPVVVLGASASLRRAVTALLDNAIDHATSAVDVRLRDLRRHVALEVVDDGPGLAVEAIPELFDRFHGSRSGPSEGRRHYGLGLALVADVAAQHDGRVSAEQRTDGTHGAVFLLSLPTERRVPRRLRGGRP